jgi:hypothetical protein
MMKVKIADKIKDKLRKSQWSLINLFKFSFLLAISYIRITPGKTTAEGFERMARRKDDNTKTK